MQHVAFFNFIYGALTGNDCEAAQAVQHLREWPLDVINHSYHNSHRSDLTTQPGYVPYAGGGKAISPRESDVKMGSRSAIEYDGGEGGHGATPPIGWLEDYWMGRYHGFISAPATHEATVTPTQPRIVTQRGAAPYAGPTRPPGKWE
jgi:hypothetical protein